MAAWWRDKSLSLLLLLLCGTLSCLLLAGTRSQASEIPLHQVTGVRGGSVLLPVETSSASTEFDIEWTLQAKSGPTLLIAEFVKGQLERPDPTDRFKQRLDVASETSLQIRGLEMEDAGVYKARVRLATGEVREHAFSLAVRADSARQVSGTQGGSVLLPVESPWTAAGSETEWTFQAGSNPTILIAEFANGQLKQPDPSDRFGGRLDVASETSLRIRGLEMEDAGVYKARVRLATGEIREHKFRLAVYAPLPKPQIRIKTVSRAPEGCNVTLQCQARGKGPFDLLWKRGDPPRSLEGGPDWHQLSENGTDLHVFWAFDPSNSTFTCLVRDAVDQKSESVDLLSVCPSEGVSLLRRRVMVGGAMAFILVALSVLGLWLCKSKRKTPAG